jgi:hypothetical protein
LEGEREREGGRVRERERKRERERERGLSGSYLIHPSSWSHVLWEQPEWSPRQPMERDMPWVLPLACWTLTTFDTPPKDRHLPLSQLLFSGPHLPHLLGYCSTDNYRKPARLGIYEPRQSLTLEGRDHMREVGHSHPWGGHRKFLLPV